jgi:hypothetical protein
LSDSINILGILVNASFITDVTGSSDDFFGRIDGSLTFLWMLQLRTETELLDLPYDNVFSPCVTCLIITFLEASGAILNPWTMMDLGDNDRFILSILGNVTARFQTQDGLFFCECIHSEI